jgi:hypothetical protein
MTNAVLLTIALSTVLSQSSEPLANDGLFREYGELTVGIWEGEFKSQTSFPGLVDEGDVITFRSKTKWILDKKATQTNATFYVNGVMVGTVQDMTSWDRSTKEIVKMGCNSLGGQPRSVIRKDDTGWFEVSAEAGFDGKKSAGTSITTYSNDGKKAKTVFPGGFSPTGDILPPLTINLKRADESMPTAKDYLDFVAPLVGTWDSQVIDANGKVLMETTSEWSMTPGNICAVSTEKTKDGTPVTASIHGYNPAEKNWQVTRYMADGSTARMDVEIDKKTLAGGAKAGVNYKYTLTETPVDGEVLISSWTAHLTTDNTLELRFVQGDNAKNIAKIILTRKQKK